MEVYMEVIEAEHRTKTVYSMQRKLQESLVVVMCYYLTCPVLPR